MLKESTKSWIYFCIAGCLFLGTPAWVLAADDATVSTDGEIQVTAEEQPDLEAQIKAQAKVAAKAAEAVAKHQEKVTKHAMKATELAMQHVEHAMKQIEHVQMQVNEQMQHALAQMPEFPPFPAIPPIPPVHSVEHSVDHFNGEVVTQDVKEVFPANAETQLLVMSNFGSVYIYPATDTANVTVQVRKIAGAETKEQAEELIKLRQLEIRSERNIIRVESGLKKNSNIQGNKMISAELVIYIPPIASVNLENHYGQSNVMGAKASLQIANEFGGTQIEDCVGNLRVKCQHGPLKLSNHQGDVQAEVQFGPMEVSRIQGEKIQIELSHGPLNIWGIQPNVQMHAKNQFGPVQLSLPRSFGGKLELSNKMGPLNVPQEIQPPKEEKKDGGLFPPMPEMEKNWNIEVGQGNGLIHIENQFGPIDVTWAE